MSRALFFLVLCGVFSVSCVLGADEAKPADKKADEKGVTLTESGGGWDSLMSGGHAWTIVVGSLTSIFVIAALAAGFYYYYYLSYHGYSGNVTPNGSYQYDPQSGYYTGYPPTQYQTGRYLHIVVLEN